MASAQANGNGESAAACSTGPQYKYGLGFSLWLTCNAQCAHCLTNSGPRAKESLDPDVVKRCLREGAELGMKGYQVTGGEPTIFMDRLVDLFGYGQSLGMAVAMTSNAYFASTKERGKRVFRRLMDVGLDLVRISTDTYHDPYIPFERVLLGIEAALDLGLAVHVELTLVRKNPKLADTFRSLQKYGKAITIYTNNTLPTGSAQALPEEVFLTRSVGEFRTTGCPQAKSLFIDTDGRAYYCCNFPRGLPGGEPADTSLYCVGDVYRESVRQILANMERSRISDLLYREGPNGLLALLRERFGAEEIERRHRPQARYCGLCDFCYSVAGNPALIPLIAEAAGTAGHLDFAPDPETVLAGKHAAAAAAARSGLLRIVQ